MFLEICKWQRSLCALEVDTGNGGVSDSLHSRPDHTETHMRMLTGYSSWSEVANENGSMAVNCL